MTESISLYFSETQRFRQKWLWIVFIALDALFIYGVIQQVGFGKPFGQQPVSDALLILVACAMVALSVFFLNMRLETKITSEGVFVRFFPLQLSSHRIYWDQLEECYVREYKPLKEFGGWGKRGMSYNRALTVSGNQGIQIVYPNGMKLLIGTNRPDEASEAIRKAFHAPDQAG